MLYGVLVLYKAYAKEEETNLADHKKMSNSIHLEVLELYRIYTQSARRHFKNEDISWCKKRDTLSSFQQKHLKQSLQKTQRPVQIEPASNVLTLLMASHLPRSKWQSYIPITD